MLSFKSLGLDLRITPSLSLPRAMHIPPGRPKMAVFFVFTCFFSNFFRFFGLPKNPLKFKSKKWRKKCENPGFRPPKTVPKSFQNPSKIDVLKSMRFFIDFCLKNALLPKCRHQFRIGFYSTKWLSDVFLQVAFWMDLRSKKRSKNPSKTMPGRLKNRSRKRVVF